MAEKNNEDKDKNKIFAVIVILIAAGAVLFFLANAKSYNSGTNTGGGSVETETPAEEVSITSQEWIWLNTQFNDNSTVEPSTPGAFTATFTEEGTLAVTTDCNNGNGSYEVGEGNTLTFGPMASTRKFCENSNEQDYFAQFQEVQSYLIEDGRLILILNFDSGSMIFE